MKIGFSLFLALRYLKPKRTFVSVITLISILGVTLGVILLILVMSVMNGFDLELRHEVIGFDSHLVISQTPAMANWREMEKKVKDVPGVVATAPFLQGVVIAEFDNHSLVPKLRAIDPERENQVSDIRRFIVDGQLDLSGDNAVIGLGLANALGISVGDEITIYSPGNLNDLLDEIDQMEKGGTSPEKIDRLKSMCLQKKLKVTGIFESGRDLYEVIFVPLQVGQELFLLKDGVHGLSVKADDPYKAEGIKNLLIPKLGHDVSVMTWIDLHKQLFDAIRLERSVMFFLLLFIVIVAAFGIVNTLITVTVQKTREIGVMKALGAGSWQIIGVFMGQGIVVGIFGAFGGLVLGLLLVHYRNEVIRWLSDVLQREFFSEIPAHVVPSDLVVICVSAFLICSIAALIPAWFATRLDPIKALRSE